MIIKGFIFKLYFRNFFVMNCYNGGCFKGIVYFFSEEILRFICILLNIILNENVCLVKLKLMLFIMCLKKLF